MKKITYYKIPVNWEMSGYLTIPASNEKEAIDMAEMEADTCKLPDGEYVNDSFAIDDDCLFHLEDEEFILDKSGTITYGSGTTFFMDLCNQFGEKAAIEKANNYLTMPLDENKPDYKEELKFRNELQNAIHKKELAPGKEEYQIMLHQISDFFDRIPSEYECSEDENDVAFDMENLIASIKRMLENYNE